jgi:hypothetical protein
MALDAVLVLEQQRASRFFPEYRKHDDQKYGDTEGANDNISVSHLVFRTSFHCIAGR